MKRIYIHCDGGFGNRFNVLLSGLYLADLCSLHPVIIWKENNWCGAGFEDIFDSQFEQFKDYDRVTFFKNPPSFRYIIHENQFGVHLDYKSPFSFKTEEEIKKYIDDSHLDVFFFTNILSAWVGEARFWGRVFPKIKFKRELLELANEIILKNVGKDSFYGIHIRKTDFLNEIDDNKFLDYVRKHPQNKFFICSDDKETEEKFLKCSNVFSYKKSDYVEKYVPGTWNTRITDSNGVEFNFNVNRNKKSVTDAIIDLLILSRSEIVNTNLRSSFLTTAVLIRQFRNKLVELMTKNVKQ